MTINKLGKQITCAVRTLLATISPDLTLWCRSVVQKDATKSTEGTGSQLQLPGYFYRGIW